MHLWANMQSLDRDVEELPLGTNPLMTCHEKLTTEDFSQHSEGDHVTGNDPAGFALVLGPTRGSGLRAEAESASLSRRCTSCGGPGDWRRRI